ncbi:hypothetical protein Glove_114g128 [Diversispora epigaea]|uniref:Reverse transcriptase domain-containing protein n=1 Tax=Diversispora epigaea TaxID=1348612 RepID=A0A397J4Z0_9GLOM|nr:hypothetical protein Glove_114g128 [Diversispora epigaea]
MNNAYASTNIPSLQFSGFPIMLNTVAKPNAYSIPQIADMLDVLKHLLSSLPLDLASGFWQKTHEEHEEHLRKIFTLLKNTELKINLEKCDFFKTRSFYLLLKSAEGNIVAKYSLGEFYVHGMDVVKGFQFHLKSVLAGNIDAMNYSGICYEQDIGVDKDKKEAILKVLIWNFYA